VENLAAHGRLLGALGASKGGFARAEALTPKQLSKIATHAINTRWSKRARMDVIKTSKRASITK
jgi:hypothetical protein